jgi:hypothetical protein
VLLIPAREVLLRPASPARASRLPASDHTDYAGAIGSSVIPRHLQVGSPFPRVPSPGINLVLREWPSAHSFPPECALVASFTTARSSRKGLFLRSRQTLLAGCRRSSAPRRATSSADCVTIPLTRRHKMTDSTLVTPHGETDRAGRGQADRLFLHEAPAPRHQPPRPRSSIDLKNEHRRYIAIANYSGKPRDGRRHYPFRLPATFRFIPGASRPVDKLPCPVRPTTCCTAHIARADHRKRLR